MNAHWPSRCASASSILRLGLLALLIGLVPGCKKGEGRTCYMAAECGEGLACVGDALKRCETCAGSASCQSDGSCSARDGRCIAASSEDCKQGYLCTGKGACTAKGDTCVVGGDADCEQSTACRTEGFCQAKGNNCVKPPLARAADVDG